MTAASFPSPEMVELISSLLDDGLSAQEEADLVKLLAEDPTARRYYYRQVRMHAQLTWNNHQATGAWLPGDNKPTSTAAALCDAASFPQECESAGPVAETLPVAPLAIPDFEFGSSSPVPAIAIQTLPSSYASLSSWIGGWPMAYLIALAAMGVGLMIGSLVYVSRPVDTAGIPVHPSDGNPDAAEMPKAPAVGRITAMADCVWEDQVGWGKRSAAAPNSTANPQSDLINPQSLVRLGDRLAMKSGLLEITYDTGARVILQGPVAYDVESLAGGYLSLGKLTARLEKKSEVKGQKSEDGVRETQPPLPVALFSVRTPTAVVTDLGTEFGVEVDKHGDTISHVFRGSVQVQFAGSDGKPGDGLRVLRANESTRVVAGVDGQHRIFAAPGSNPAQFVRSIPTRKSLVFDLADVVASGNGFSGLRGRGIEPTTGRPTETVRPMNLQGYAPIVGDGKYHRAQTSPLVDGVFIPAGRAGAVQVDSAGHTFAEFGQTDGMTGSNIWAGGTIPVPASSMPTPVSDLLRSLPPSWVLSPTKLGDVDYSAPGRGLIFLHANNGITFDLEAIRRANPGFKQLRFRATAGNVEPVSATGAAAGYADLWVLVDGQVRFRRRGINGCSGAFPILFSIAESDRFLTLAATDGGNTMAGDWILFGSPVLEMVTSRQKGE